MFRAFLGRGGLTTVKRMVSVSIIAWQVSTNEFISALRFQGCSKNDLREFEVWPPTKVAGELEAWR